MGWPSGCSATTRSPPASRASRQALPGAAEHAPHGGTTHVSAVDADGQRGLALVVDRVRLGRDRARHRHPAQQHARRVRPGRPAAHRAGSPPDEHDVADDRRRRRTRPRLVVGSAGSIRLRGAIMQVIANVVGHGLGVADAIDRAARPYRRSPRSLRGRIRRRRSSTVSRRWATTSSAGAGATSTSAARTRSRSAHDGELAAAGDARRGGAGVVVG